ncbi:MgtC/SapB family protein [Marivita sp. GX14005]|uniref:MgtC/SapB family protein n=1 Tax=Marivita sp. GX14005 TaxID=2942276 RepID=UPI00201941C5|nr:MgtC/SapB family protein [Marivita sp. GX14005]MCL3883609.1 MgtC/SapB family protein [Marivita sp. GX14005]
MTELFIFSTVSFFQAAVQFACAVILPLSIGLERYLRDKPIDFRPYVVISVAACGILITTTELSVEIGDSDTRIDPTRVMEGVITGIGFLGAGAMFREGDFVKGAGTAASIWSAGAIGLICGAGEIGIALVVTALVLIVMIVSAPFTEKWDTK